MTVSSIISEKGGKVLTGTPKDTLEAVSSVLASNKIGALVIVESDGAVCGIASERDIVRQIAAKGSDALSLPVSSCMTEKVISCEPDSTVDDVMGVMNTNKFRHLPVMKDGKLLGIISIGDVVKRKIEQAEREAADLKQYIAG